jgi:hypothetical protein
VDRLHQRQIRFAISGVLDPVRQQLDRYGITKTLSTGCYYDTPGEALEAFHAAPGTAGDGRAPDRGKT